MTGAGNSCRTWQAKFEGLSPRLCSTCYEPIEICVDCHKTRPEPPPDPDRKSSRNKSLLKERSTASGPISVLKVRNTDAHLEPVEEEKPKELPLCSELKHSEPLRLPLEPVVYVRRQIDADLCAKCFNKTETENGESKQINPCSAECRPLSTMLNLKYTKGPRSKPSYTNSILLDDETFVGRVFPITFRLRRENNHCPSCGNDLCTSEYVTDNSNLMLLSNCCDVEVYSHRKLDNWCKVAVTTIKGDRKFVKKVLDTCHTATPHINKKEEEKKANFVMPDANPPPKKKKKTGKKGKKDKGRKSKMGKK